MRSWKPALSALICITAFPSAAGAAGDAVPGCERKVRTLEAIKTPDQAFANKDYPDLPPNADLCYGATDPVSGAIVVFEEHGGQKYLAYPHQLDFHPPPKEDAEKGPANVDSRTQGYIKEMTDLDTSKCGPDSPHCTNSNVPGPVPPPMDITTAAGKQILAGGTKASAAGAGAKSAPAGAKDVGQGAADRGPASLAAAGETDSLSIRSAGATYALGASSQPLPAGNLVALGEAVNISENGVGLGLAQAAIDKRSAIERAAKSDQSTLSNLYTNVPFGEVTDRLQRAKTELARAADQFDQATGGDLVPGARLALRNNYSNAAEKVTAALGLMQDEQQKDETRQISLFGNLFKEPETHNPELESKVAAAFGAPLAHANTNEALQSRLAMLAGLPPEARAAAESRLQLLDQRTLKFSDGRTVKVNVAHNGYILGGGKTSTDCSSFISSLLTEAGRRARLTTLDLTMIYLYKTKGAFPRPPVYERGRLSMLRKISDAFEPINLYQGALLQPGDLLVSRLPWKEVGHVTLVERFDRKAMRVHMIEASQTSGSVVGRDFDLSADDEGEPMRRVRPGLFGLRLVKTENSACKLTREGR